jgi:hypothetical protein
VVSKFAGTTSAFWLPLKQSYSTSGGESLFQTYCMHFRFEDHDTAVVNNIHLILTVLKCNNFPAAPDDVQSDERRHAATWMGRSWYDHHDLTYATVPSSLLRSWWVPHAPLRRRSHKF